MTYIEDFPRLQEAHDAILAHFSQPDVLFSVAGEHASECFYRFDGTPECPRRCAAGVILKNELYDQKFENIIIGGVVEQSAELAENFKGISLDYLSAAQREHDVIGSGVEKKVLTLEEGRQKMIDRLHDLGQRYGLAS